jgi:hypothetical protein
LFAGIASGFSSYAQVNFNFNQSNLGQGAASVDHQSIEYISVLSVAPTISIKTSNANFQKSGLPTILSTALVQARTIGTGGQLLNLLSIDASQATPLSTSFSPIYTSLLGLLSGGLMNIRYTIPNPEQFAWKFGVYTTNLTYGLSGIALGSIAAKASTITVTVDPFLKVPSMQNTEITIDAFDYFRNRPLTPKTSTMAITGTVNAGIRIKSATPYFGYTNGYSGATDPRVPATILMTQMAASKASPLEYLSGTTFKTLTEPTGMAVPVGNTSNVTMSYSLSPDVLKNNFLKKGTYTLNLNHEVFDAEGTGAVPNQSLTSSLIVNVADMAELIINQQDVNLVFNTAEDYKKGVQIDMPAHVSLSATSAYDLFIKANTTTISNGKNSMPITALQVSVNDSDGTSTTSVPLKETRQRLFGISPVLDKTSTIRYSIPPSEAVKLIGKASGTYNASVTYSLVAP